MAEVNKFQTDRLFQSQEFLDWHTTGDPVAGAGNFTGVCAVPDPFADGAQACGVTQVWFSQPGVGSPVTNFTVHKLTGGSLPFFVAFLFVK
jgi:hypothetical protein